MSYRFMDKPVRNFLETAIRSLSKEDFDEAVMIFQKHYLHNEVVNVDGCNDGGSDIKIYQGRREQKKCVQVTINKNIESKLKNDLIKVDKTISQYGYSNQFDFFCNVPISEEKVNEYKQSAIDTYDIVLNIYESKRLSQLECREFTDYIYSLHKDVVINPKELSLDKATKVIYDMLANGRDSSDIKNSLYLSVLLCVLYEHQSMKEADLKKEVETRLKKQLPNFHATVSSLRSKGQIRNDENNPGNICLDSVEAESIKDIIASSLQLEKEFIHSIASILGEEDSAENVQKVVDVLTRLYKQYYKIDIDEKDNLKDIERKRNGIFSEFSKSLKSLLPNQDNIDAVKEQIMQLCANNTYINKITASESVLSLYHSDKLSNYLNQKEKRIYLDTPTFVYLLCGYFYNNDSSEDWNDSLYRSMKSLMKQRDTSKGRITFHIMSSYLAEVANELKKALQISWIESSPFSADMGETANTFYNYYTFMKENELFEVEDEIECFEDFVDRMGFDEMDTNDAYFTTKVIKTLNELAESYEVYVEPFKQFDDFSNVRDNYEKLLYLKNKQKTRSAANKDVEQTLFLLLRNQFTPSVDNTDWFFITWDNSVALLRNDLMDKDKENAYHYYTIANPAQLSNRFSIENFDIDNSAITNDIFIYADKHFDVIGKAHNLIDIIAPVLGNKDSMNRKLISGLNCIRKQQLEIRDQEVTVKQNKNLPIEDALIYLMPKADKEGDYQGKICQFTAFMNSEDNTDFILNTLSMILEAQSKHMEYDLSEFNIKVYARN